ncbi:MAG TPA: hypothetical protein GXZ48_05235 [Acholeplasmataceae bacterium]|nr:hypothetical protein [Acholeplasmataceae bacterium]
MKIYGKVYSVDKKQRIISIIINKRLEYFHMSNKVMRDFKAYLYKKPYVFLDVEDEKVRINGIKCYPIKYFIKIIVPRIKRTNVYYDLSMIRRSIRSLMNRIGMKMFLDLEFSLPTSNRRHIPEIIQYGMIIEDENGNIVFEDSSLVKPTRRSSLNKRTLKFLSLDYKNFNNACSYIEFYQLLERLIKEYDVKIIAWGKNDIIALEKSFKINHLMPLDVQNRYMNLMQVMKNYYNYKQEKGLFSTYHDLTNTKDVIQTHDAFQDAFITREVFHLFKQKINEDEN